MYNKLKKFIDFLNKDSIIYHFTTLNAIESLTDKNFMQKYGCEILTFISYNDHISTTRDFSLVNNPMLDFNSSTHPVRISLDGDKISHKYKVKPLNGLVNPDAKIFGTDLNHLRVKHKSEREEVICPLKDRMFPLKDFIVQIDFLNSSKESDLAIFEKVKEALDKTDIKVQSVRKFTSIKLNESINTESFTISYKDNIVQEDEFFYEEVQNAVQYLPYSMYKRTQKIACLGEYELVRYNSTKWYLGKLIENKYYRNKFCTLVYIETDSYKKVKNFEESNNSSLLNEALKIIKGTK